VESAASQWRVAELIQPVAVQTKSHEQEDAPLSKTIRQRPAEQPTKIMGT